MNAAPPHIVIDYATRVTPRRWPHQLWISLLAATISPPVSAALAHYTALDFHPGWHDRSPADALEVSLAVLLYLGPPIIGMVYGNAGLVRVCAQPTRWKGLAIGAAIAGIMLSLLNFLWADAITACL